MRTNDMYLKKELYELIRSDESIFDFIQESSLDGLWYWDLENPENEWMNAKFWTVLGYNPDEMPHKSSAWQSIINQEDLKVAVENFTKHCENPNHPYDQIVRYTHKNSSTVWIRCRGLAIRDNNGKPIRMLGAHHDISELKRREIELQNANNKAVESEDKYRLLLENAGVGIGYYNAEGIVILYNKIAAKHLNGKPEDFKGKSFFEIFPKADAEFYFDRIKQAINSSEPILYEDYVPLPNDEKWFQSIFTKIIDLENNDIGIQIISHDITKLKSTEFELQKAKEKAEQSEARLLEAQKATKVGSWETDLSNLKVIWSEETYRIFEINSDTFQASHQAFLNFVHPDDKKIVDDAFVKSFGTKDYNSIEHRIITAKDTIKYVIERWKIVFDELGNPSRAVGTCQDISESKQAEEKLKTSDMIFNHSLDMLCIAGFDGYFKVLNPAWTKTLGWSDEELLSKPWIDFVHPDDRDNTKDIKSVIVDGKEVYQFANRYICKDGKIKWLSWNSFSYPEEKIMFGVARDITERKQAEEKIREKDIQFRKLSSNLPDLIFQFTRRPDGSYYVPIASEGIKNIFGCSPEDVVEDFTPISRVIFPEDAERVINDIEYSAKHLNYFTCEFRVQIPGRPIQWILSRSTPEKLPDGSVTWYGFNANITERKQAEDALLRSEAKLNALFSSMSEMVVLHELVFDNEGKPVNYRITDCNDAFTRITGIKREAAVGRLATELYGTEEPPYLKEYVKVALTRLPYNYETYFNPMDKYFSISVVSPEENQFATVTTDISEHKRAELSIQDKSEEIAVQNEELNLANQELLKAKERAEESERRILIKNEEYEAINEELLQTNDELIAAKDKAEESEEKYRLLFVNNPQPMWIYDLETLLFLEVNKAAVNHYGYSKEEFLSMTLKDIRPAEDIPALMENIRNTRSGLNTAGEWRHLKKNGEIIAVEITSHSILFNDRKARHILISDITRRKLAEQDLIKAKEKAEESELQFRNLFENASDAIFIAEHESGIIIDVNHAAENLMLMQREEIIGIHQSKLHPPEKDEFSKDTFRLHKNLLEKDIPPTFFENNVVRKDNTQVPVEILATKILYKGKECLVGTFRNVSERKHSENEILKAKEKAEENEAKLIIQNNEIELNNNRLESLQKISQFQTDSIQELLDFALNEAVQLTNSKIGYIYFYKEESKQFILNTWSKEVMKECLVLDPNTVYDLDKTGCWGEAVRQRKPIVINDYQEDNIIKKGTPEGHVKLEKFLTIPVIIDNKIVAVAGVANKIHDYNNADIRQLSLLMDSVWKISERIQLIKDLRVAKEKAEESDRLKSAFLANMSHEIRTPMNGILGFAYLLKDTDLSGDEQQEYIEIIEKSGKRMLNIINDIIDISKIEAGLMEYYINEFNINEQIDYTYAFFKPEAEAKGISLSFKNTLPQNDAIIKTDREKVYAILTNLVKNAIKYSEKGSIEFGYNLKGESEHKQLEFFVKDTGIGIPKDRLSAIFERFIQADIADKKARQGAGLGLAIAKAYVEILGGKIWVESEVGKGSTFYFTLPYNAEGATETIEQSPLTAQDNNDDVRKLKIMIAEDDEVSSLLIEKYLEMFVKETILVSTGVEAVETCRNNPNIDLIMMDIQMPDINGYEATQQIREFDKKVVIISQTAYGLRGDREKSLEVGCNDYIAKPIDKETLLSLISKYFE